MYYRSHLSNDWRSRTSQTVVWIYGRSYQCRIFFNFHDSEDSQKQNKNVVSTSHAEDADVTMSAVVDANKNSFYINDLFHSHSGGTLNPSRADRNYRNSLIDGLDQQISAQNYLYIPNKINKHLTPINYRFGTDKYNKNI